MKNVKRTLSRAARQLSIVHCPLSIAAAALLLAACSNETAPGTDTLTPIGIGQIEISGTASTRAVPTYLGTLTVASSHGESNTYAYNAGAWMAASTEFYFEDVMGATNTYTATTGAEALCPDQEDVAAYQAADYIAGVVLLDPDARQFVTASTEPLTHRHVDVVLTLTQGTGWESGAFDQAIAGAEIRMYTSSSETITPCHAKAVARAIIPLAELPANDGKLASIRLTDSETAQDITYNLANTAKAGQRLNITATYDNHRGLSGIGITITPWVDEDVPGVLPGEEPAYDVVIATKADLIAFRNRVNDGEFDLTAIQVADIDLTGEGSWTPIAHTTTANAFRGTYNGGGYTITGLTITGTATGVSTGLFGDVGAGAILTGIHLKGVEIDAVASHIGALAGVVDGIVYAPAVISHCTAEGKVASTGTEIGGLVGIMANTHLTHCHATCDVTATGSNSRVGGLAGATDNSTIAACSATGSVSANSSVGGLVGGTNNSNIYACRATGTVTAGNYASGGFIGNNFDSTITGCYATGGVSGGGGYRGTFAGNNANGTIAYCHAVKGGYEVTDPVGWGDATGIVTDENLRYTTVASPDIPDLDNVLTIRYYPGTSEAMLPPVSHSFKASEIWTEGEMPETIDN